MGQYPVLPKSVMQLFSYNHICKKNKIALSVNIMFFRWSLSEKKKILQKKTFLLFLLGEKWSENKNISVKLAKIVYTVIEKHDQICRFC
jgi:hypothetical protein